MISRTAQHAIRALVALAREPRGRYVGAAHVARQIAAPRNYLGKLLQNLADVGLLESQKGLGGGFRLARDPQRITLLDVAEPLDRIERRTGCILGNEECNDQVGCAVHQRWKRVRARYLQLLSQTTIADLAFEPKRAARRPLRSS
ncbi:MAG: hypothetical protein C4297_12015 [Gemmataceae bacterium]